MGWLSCKGGCQEWRHLAANGNPAWREEMYTCFPVLPLSYGAPHQLNPISSWRASSPVRWDMKAGFPGHRRVGGGEGPARCPSTGTWPLLTCMVLAPMDPEGLVQVGGGQKSREINALQNLKPRCLDTNPKDKGKERKQIKDPGHIPMSPHGLQLTLSFLTHLLTGWLKNLASNTFFKN